MGSGFLAPYITSAIYLGPSLLAARIGGLGLVFGMTMLAGVTSLAISQILRRFRRLLPPEVSGVVVLMVGVSMVPVALTRFMGIGGGDQISEPREWLVGLITLATILSVTVLAGRVRLYATAIGLAVGYGAAAFLGLFRSEHFATVRDLPIFGVPPVSWSGLAFESLLIVPFLAAALASNVKDAGLLISAQKANDAAWRHPDTSSMSGGLVAGGLGNIASGALGGVGLGISAGSVGLAVATGVTARIVGLATAAIFLSLAFMPKVTAVLALVPAPVMGAGLIYVACHLVGSGTDLIASRMLDARRIYVIGLPLLAGVGSIALPDLFASAPPWAAAVLSSPLATATILVLTLNLVLNVGVSSRASMTLPLEAGTGESIARFVDKHAASWGARREVINRAIPAITDWCEELREVDPQSGVALNLRFDEFQFVATISRLSEAAPRTSTSSEGRGPSPENLARTMEQRYGCSARLGPDGELTLVFEH